MRLSELLEFEVFTEDGRALGKVKDVRLITERRKLRVDGFCVGTGALGIRLGFHRDRVKGPWVLERIFDRLERRARYVPWKQVMSCGDGRVIITGETVDLPADDG